MNALDEAIALYRQGKKELAKHHFEEILNADFDNPIVLYFLGTYSMQEHKVGIAANLFRQAITLKADAFESWNNLGNCYKIVNKEEDAKACWLKCLEVKNLQPIDYADIYSNISTLYINSGKPAEGMQYADKAIEYEPQHIDAHWNKSLLLLEQGRYGEGFDLYEWGFRTGNRLNRTYGKEIPFWDGTPGKKVVIWGEQGMGDEILFASMLPDLAKQCKEVIFECHPRLEKLLKHSFPYITIFGTRKDAYINWIFNHPDIDARLSMPDMGRFFRRELKDFPEQNVYLKATEDRVQHYKSKLAKISDRLKIGISWTGGYLKTRKDWRSIPLEKWLPILRNDCDFISLQYTPDAYNTIAEVEDKYDVRIHHWPSAVQNYDYHETAALVTALDLVITVNTTVHHLSGALGKPTWTLTPKGKAWRYYTPDGVRFPWYPTVRCIEQPAIMEWDSVMDEVGIQLHNLVEKSEVVCV